MVSEGARAIVGVALVAAAVYVGGSILLQSKDPQSFVPPPAIDPRLLEVMPDAESTVELALGDDGITRLSIHTWLDPACAKDFIVVLNEQDILRCRVMLPIDRAYLPRHRYEHRTHCATANDDLRSGRFTVSDAEVWVENDCEKGATSWQPNHPANPPNAGDVTSRFCSC